MPVKLENPRFWAIFEHSVCIELELLEHVYKKYLIIPMQNGGCGQ